MKSNLRRKIISLLKTDFDKKGASDRITAFAVSEAALKDAGNIFVFLSTENEPDTSGIIAEAVKAGKKVFVPVVRGNEMLVSEYVPGDVLTAGAFGIREPSGPVVSDIKPDVTFVPLVAFDKHLNRLGHGKGFYDRYFSRVQTEKIVPAFSLQRAGEVPHDTHDIPMDAVITEEGVFR